jgi:hypothetical protein
MRRIVLAAVVGVACSGATAAEPTSRIDILERWLAAIARHEPGTSDGAAAIAIFLRVLEEFRHRYLVSYTPRGVSKDGWHRLSVRVKRSGPVKARPGYVAGS